MCKSLKINRRNVLRVIGDYEVTGTDLHRCAVGIIAFIGGHPCQTGKVEDILVKLVQQGSVVLRDATLRCADAKKYAKKLAEQEDALRRERARAASHRAGGIKRLSQFDLKDPEWDPNELTDDEKDYLVWVESTLCPSGSGFNTEQDAIDAAERMRTAEIVGLMLEQLKDDRRDMGLLPA